MRADRAPSWYGLAESCWTERPVCTGSRRAGEGSYASGQLQGHDAPCPSLGVTATALSPQMLSHLTPGQSSPTQKCQPASLAGRGGGACTPRLRPHAVAVHGTPPWPAPRLHRNATGMALFLPGLWGPVNPPWPPSPAPLPRGGSGSMHPVPVTLHTAEGLERGRHIPGQ